MTAKTVGPFQFRPRNPAVAISDYQIVVDVLVAGDVNAARDQLIDMGMKITGVWQQLVSGVVAIDAIDDLAAIDNVRLARPLMMQAFAGSATTQGDIAQRSDEIRDSLGLDGTGVTIGILSDSFDSLGGAEDDVATGDLPGADNPDSWTTPVNVLNDNSYGGSDEGRAIAQVIHDVAPGANLAFATAA
ncbi:MAG: peptidase S8, partial [Planctomycetia bacterium]|nr:peptidase S8 [Planctomycetia bacterium]